MKMSDSPLQYVLSKEEWQYYRECEADAMRYRWLRNNLYVEDGCLETAVNIYCHSAPNKADIDAAIDAAMSNTE